MFNVLLDKLPTEYKGFPIDSDFQIGIQIWQIMEEKELSERERLSFCLSLLFMDEDDDGKPLPIPDLQMAIEGLQWFLSDWYHDNPNEKDKIKVTDYDIDQWRIYSAFRTQYGINLNTDKLHFWEFMGLLTTLDECAYTRVVGIRQQKINPKMSAEEKKALKELKAIYSLKEVEELTSEEQEAVDAFMKYVKQGK